MRVNDNLEVTEFVEKPTDSKVIRSLAVGDSAVSYTHLTLPTTVIV